MSKKVESKKKKVEEVTNEREVTINEIVTNEKISKSQKMRELYDLGCNVSNVSKLLDSHYSFVYGVLQKYTNDNVVNKEQKVTKSQKIREMYDEGITIGSIAKQLNSNYSYVFSVVKKHRESK